MQFNGAVINPQKTKSSPDIGPVAVMAATRADLYLLCELLNFSRDDFQRLLMSRLYFDNRNPDGISVVGPFIGAPYAVMLLENLIAWGARQIIFIGWCGAISAKVKIGDIILPTSVYPDEGTSKHYVTADKFQVLAISCMASRTKQVLENHHIDFHEGRVWTTDAVYRETRREVAMHQRSGILAVDMEFSALHCAALFRKVDLAGILVVSDELSSLNWRPGFKHERFSKGRITACRQIKELLCDLKQNSGVGS